LLWAAILSVVTVAGTTAVVATPAFAANTLYPSNCRRVTTDQWGSSCWVGHNYARISVGVMAVQYVLLDTGHNPGPIDCIFGSRSDSATVRYQQEFGLEADGIVGGYTWSHMQGWLSSSGVVDTYGGFYNVGIDGLRFYWQYVLQGSWFVRDPYYGNRYIAVASYVSQNVTPFCP
jgi:hypothetical protein